MKQLSQELAAHIGSRITTLAACWLVTRKDGTTLGFTDHDRALEVGGIPCQPENGLSPSAMSGGPDLATGGGDVAGTLSSSALTERDLEAGRWDNAEVAMYLVNWQDPEQQILMRRAKIGEITRSGHAFRAELRGLAHLLESTQGRVFSRICDADLGDNRCRVFLDDPAYRATGTIEASGLDWLRSTDFSAYEAGWFARGRVEVLDGQLAGFASEIASHQLENSKAMLALFQALSEPLDVGTRITVRAGCDKQLATCSAKFSNHLNFQGFPHMPGSDFALSYPNRNTGKNDGSALVS